MDCKLINPPHTSIGSVLANRSGTYCPPLNPTDYDSLCRTIRAKIIEMSCRARTPHLGGSLSCVEILAALYGRLLKIDPRDPHNVSRDRFIFSKGHAAPALYATLALFGFIEQSKLDAFATDGASLGEQTAPESEPGIEAGTGSLGHGLPLGLGMALAAKITGLSYRVFVLMSDGECNEGSVWEAAMMAPAKGVDNLVAIVDFNKWQATGRSEQIMSLSSLSAKFKAFGWNACEVDGHNVTQILSALSEVPDGSGRPLAVIAHTVKGKGISFMEDDNNWHYRIPTEEELCLAYEELGLK